MCKAAGWYGIGIGGSFLCNDTGRVSWVVWWGRAMWGNAAAEGNSLALQGLFLRLAALRVEGNSLRRCGASSLAREPGGRTAGIALWDNKPSTAENVPTT